MPLQKTRGHDPNEPLSYLSIYGNMSAAGRVADPKPTNHGLQSDSCYNEALVYQSVKEFRGSFHNRNIGYFGRVFV